MSSGAAYPQDDHALAELAAWVDDIADRFEAAWQSPAPPRITDYVGEAIGPRRLALLLELVRLDAAYRRRLGEHRQVEDYLPEFPELRSQLQCGTCVADFARIPGYEILNELGHGGMGVVYRARQLSLNRVVALKMILAGAYAGPRQRARFRAEAEAAARLQHPNIVGIYEVGEQDGRPYCAMEYVDGGSLAQRLAGAPLPPRLAAQLVETLARAVLYAHEHGIIHRDLKPANVLVSGAGVTGEWSRVTAQKPGFSEETGFLPNTHHTPLTAHQLKITDFGLAKQVSSAGMPQDGEPSAEPAYQTQTGEILGTPSYMAPEQAEGRIKEIGPAVDVYALGAILYELLTGRPPFRGATTLDTLEQVRSREPVQPSRLQPRLPRDLGTICTKALAKAPGRRYSSAGEIADDLRRFLDGRSIRARPVSSPEKLWRWCRRKPLVAGLLLTVALALTGGLAGVIWQWRLAEEHRHQAEQRAEENRRFLHASNVKLAEQAWRNADIRQMLDLLGRDVPREGQEDLRSFAWHHLWRLCHGERATLIGHTDEVYSVVYSHSGATLATAGKDGTVRLWEAATGKELAVLPGHADEAAWATFSPDDRTLATAAGAGTIRLWDIASRQVSAFLRGHTGAVVTVEFSPDGRLLASAGNDRLIKLWELPTGRLRQEFRAHDHRITALAFAPDGRTLASASRDQTAKLWDLAAGQTRGVPPPLRATLVGHGSWVHGVAFSHDGRRLATASVDHLVKLWDPFSGREQATLRGHGNWVKSVAFSPDDRMLASCGSDATVRLWDLLSGKQVNLIRGHAGRVWSVAFAADGKTLASAGADGAVKLWDPLAHQGRVVFDAPHGVYSLAFSPTNRLLVLASGNKAMLRDMATGQIQTTLFPLDCFVKSVILSFQDVLAAGIQQGGKRTIIILAPNTSQERVLTPMTMGEVHGIAIAPDAGLAAAAQQHGVTLWDLASGNPRTVFRRDRSHIRSVAFSPDGRTLVSGGDDHHLKVWDTVTLQERDPQSVRWSRGTILGLAFAPDGRTLAIASADHAVQLWDVARDRERNILTLRTTLLGHRDAVTVVAFSPDGKTLATGSQDHTVRLWDLATGQELFTLDGHTGPVRAVAFSPDGRTLASGGETREPRGEVILWQAAPAGD